MSTICSILHFLDSAEYSQPLGDLQSFENEWLEVEVRPPRIGTQDTVPKALTVPNAIVDREKNVPHFLRDAIDIAYLQDLDNDCKYNIFNLLFNASF